MLRVHCLSVLLLLAQIGCPSIEHTPRASSPLCGRQDVRGSAPVNSVGPRLFGHQRLLAVR